MKSLNLPGSAALTVSLLGTLAIGLYLRWFLAGQVTLSWNFLHLRHAHSHLGYFGLLFPLAWMCWDSCRTPMPSHRVLTIYGIATFVALLGFLRAGYGPEAIAGSTVVGGIWLISAWPLRKRMRDLGDPLAAILPGVIGALACIPPIAIFLRKDPELAQGFVATFLSTLLLTVIVPSALATLRVRTIPWPALWISGLLGSVALGVWPSLPSRMGLFIFGALLLRTTASPHLRLAWGAVALGLMAIALGLLPNSRPVALGAIHFLILGPILGTLVPAWLRKPISPWAWFLNLAGVGLLSGPLILQGLGYGSWTAVVSALGGTFTVIWWGVVIWRERALGR